MPQDLLVDATPCAKQRELMEAHGFKFDPQTDDENSVTWRGCGISIVMLRSGVFSAAALTRLVVRQTERKVIQQIRKPLWKFLGLREIDSPVPFELVEMDLKTQHSGGS